MTNSLVFGLALVVVIAATFVFAGMAKDVTDMGLPTVAMGILGSLISSVAAAATLLLPSLVSNLFQFGGDGNTRQLFRRLWPMLLTVVMTTLPASAWIIGSDTTRTRLALGVALVTCAIWTLTGKKIAVAPQREKSYSLVTGLTTGLLAGETGVLMTPAVPWVQSLSFKKDGLVQMLGTPFTSSTLASVLGLWWHNALPIQSLSLSALAIFPMPIGQWISTHMRRVVSPLVFKRCFLSCLVGLGTETMLRAVWLVR